MDLQVQTPLNLHLNQINCRVQEEGLVHTRIFRVGTRGDQVNEDLLTSLIKMLPKHTEVNESQQKKEGRIERKGKKFIVCNLNGILQIMMFS